MLDLHRHNSFSFFDGYGNADELAKLAKSKGYTALGESNHGNTSGLVEHYFGCIEAGIKPVMGVEAYFQPVFNKEKPRYHLCIFAKDLEGYENMNRLITDANKYNFYYKPTVTFELLKKYRKGLICTSACIGGFISQAIVKENQTLAAKAILKFKQIFKSDFYVEIMPYKLSEVDLQEKANKELIELAEENEIKCILTSDSHYGPKEEWPTYLKMHEMSGTKYDVKATYGERYMPDYDDLYRRFVRMHKGDYGVDTAKSMAKQYYRNLDEIEAKVDGAMFEKLEISLPRISDNSAKELQHNIKVGLKKRGKYNKESLARCKFEYDVITYHGFQDYFLIVQDYVKWAKDNDILVGPGRGSVCNSMVAYALEITDVDSLYFDLDFNRFLRKDKKKFPDIDLDFETDRRGEVIEYILNKYPDKTVRISSYGLNKVDNLVNDLCKVCGAEEEKARIKTFINMYVEDKHYNAEAAAKTKDYEDFNRLYDNIILHFGRLYGKVKYLGTHSAGVAISGDDIVRYTSIRRYKDAYISAYDHNNIEKINAVKLDVLGLRTLSSLQELQRLTGKIYDYTWFEDEEVFKHFREGDTCGVFQFEKPTARHILENINADCMEDIIAASALNRPGPLSMKMPEAYAANKQETDNVADSRYYAYTKTTYGTIVYQEQVMEICRQLGGMTYGDADLVIRFMKSLTLSANVQAEFDKETIRLRSLFVAGCAKNGVAAQEANEIYDKMQVYTFNKGHSAGYTMISVQEMWYKIYYPVQFWYAKMKYAPTEDDLNRFKLEAVRNGIVIFLPHVNGSSRYSIIKRDGEHALREGLVNIKNVGLKAAEVIQTERLKNGNYVDYDDFLDRVPKRSVNARVVASLKEAGALEFDKKIYNGRVLKYNSALYSRGIR